MSQTSAPPQPPTAPPSWAFLTSLVTLTVVMNAVGRGIPESFAVYLLPVEASLGVDRSQIALTYSVNMLTYGVAAPFIGHLIDRFGARACYMIGLISMGLGSLLAAHVQSIAQYYIAVGVFGGLGSASMSMVAASSLLSRWYLSRMGTMSSLPYAAAGLGMLLFPPIAQRLMLTHSWRDVVQWQGMFVLGLIPLLLVLPLGRYSAGSPAWQSAKAAAAAATRANTQTGWTLRTALRTSAFWLLFLAYFLTSLTAYSVLPHSVAYLVERGFDPVLAASAFGMTGVLSTIGILGTGWLSDTFGRQVIGAMTYVITISGIVCLIAILKTPSTWLVYGFVLGFGLMQGARGPIIVALVAKLFSGGPVGAIFGVLSIALGLGAATGSWLSGFVHTRTGSYGLAFTIAIVSAIAAMLTFLLAPSLRNEVAHHDDVTAR